MSYHRGRLLSNGLPGPPRLLGTPHLLAVSGWPPDRRTAVLAPPLILGRNKDSDAALAELIVKDATTGAFQIAEVYAFRGETDRAFEWLERAYASRDGGLAQLKGDPLLKSVEHDRRYAAFLKKTHLPA